MASEKKRSTKPPGFVAMYRDLLSGHLFRCGPWAVTLYLWLSLRARYKDGDVPIAPGKSVSLKRGQTLVGWFQVERALSAPRHKLTRQVYRTALATLVTAELVTSKSTSLGTTVTVLAIADLDGSSAAMDEEVNRMDNHLENLRDPAPDIGADTVAPTTNKKGLRDGQPETGETKPGKGKRSNEKGVFPPKADTHRLRARLSEAWTAITGRSVEWTPERQSQVALLVKRYSSDELVKAVKKYEKIRKIKDPYPGPGPKSWAFETFFTPKVLDLVLEQELSYFSKRNSVSPNMDYLIGDTPTSAYDGVARRK